MEGEAVRPRERVVAVEEPPRAQDVGGDELVVAVERVVTVGTEEKREAGHGCVSSPWPGPTDPAGVRAAVASAGSFPRSRNPRAEGTI